jgi:predicted pyridoxine 5'-phosphate oxidase superfamily flavin-nucleotide-binding protein
MKINEELKKLIESTAISLSTVNQNNTPHTIYVLYAKIIKENKILITDNHMLNTKENLLKNPNVSLSLLVGDAGFELIGKAKYFSEGEFIEKIKKIDENKNMSCKGAVLVTVEKIVKMS